MKQKQILQFSDDDFSHMVLIYFLMIYCSRVISILITAVGHTWEGVSFLTPTFNSWYFF